jgi:hypothetical protein
VIVECNWSAFFCPEKMTVPAGQLLADAVRANGWKHVREPGGKSKNYCPAHFPK